MTDKIVVYSTCGSSEEAESLARHILETRLAACVSVITQIQSYYWREGKVEQATECLLVIKTSGHLFGQLRSKLESLHSCEIPELLALSVIAGSPRSLAWLDAELRNPPV
jgi:periplasmic divalent cation tolerance protein